ncbi:MULTISPECIES: helix-turn-helix transcriptional regulator [Vibrio]|uniref:LexA family transcriptional regulator n=1 Tax=Vibrio TaxID=662 RepID=UPI000803A66C|nr:MULTISPECIES: helix-turn-helix transcriptional regulator [Vibrio]ANP65029.1 XRE family transcriptional regulator [Vibrio alginolyticus]MDW3057354.1 helix-turn-helix transcriptional regulator [Vibrio sp. 1978]
MTELKVQSRSFTIEPMVHSENVRSNFAQRLAQACTKAGIEDHGRGVILAKALKVTPKAVSKWLNAESMPRQNKMEELANLLKVDLFWLQYGKQHSGSNPNEPQQPTEANAEILGEIDAWDRKTPLSDDEVEVPFFADIRLSAGSGEVAEREHTGLKLRFAKSTLRRYNVPPECAVCVKATGNSMEPVLPDGSTVGIDTSSTGVVDGKMYAINHSGELRVKLLYKTPGGGLRVRSYNAEEHPEERYSQEQAKDIVVLGRVFWYSVML